MSNFLFVRYASLIVMLVIVAPALAQRTDTPGTPVQVIGVLFRTLVTPPLSTTLVDSGGTWFCSALNVTAEPLTVTIRARSVAGDEIDLGDACSLDAGKGCAKVWHSGVGTYYCTFTFRGREDAIRAGAQLTDDDVAFSVFAEAH